VGRRTTLIALDQIKEINMTPLIDLSFLLLITFIITFPLIEQGIPVNLPRGQASEIDQTKTRSITVDVSNNIYLDKQKVTKEELTAEMMTLGSSDPEATVMVRADEAIKYGSLIEVLKILHDAKIARMALVTSPEK
jgi:biopolymer transport protein TolR